MNLLVHGESLFPMEEVFGTYALTALGKRKRKGVEKVQIRNFKRQRYEWKFQKFDMFSFRHKSSCKYKYIEFKCMPSKFIGPKLKTVKWSKKSWVEYAMIQSFHENNNWIRTEFILYEIWKLEVKKQEDARIKLKRIQFMMFIHPELVAKIWHPSNQTRNKNYI